MAYVDDTLKDDEQDQQGGPSINGSGAPASAAPSAGVAKSPQQKTPGNFANLNEYLRVNQPQQFGQQVAGKIGGEIDQGNQAVDQAGQQFKQRADSNVVQDQGGLINQVGQDPTKVDQAGFAKLRDANYGGPKSLSDTQDLYSQVQGAAGTAVGKAGASKTEGGRFALLDSYFGRPQYNQGQKSLDNLLIQNDPGAQQSFQNVQQRAADLSGRAKSLEPELAQYGGLAAQKTADTRKAARNAVGIDESGNLSGAGPLQDLYASASQRAQAMGGQNQQAYQSEVDAAKQNRYGLNADFLKALGLDPAQQNGLGVDASKYLTASQAPTAEQALTADEAARGRALEGLAGTHSQFGNFDEAGKAAANPFNFNKAGYLNEVGTQQQAMNSELAANKTAQDAADWVPLNITQRFQGSMGYDPNTGAMIRNPQEVEEMNAALAKQAQVKAQKQSILDKYLKGVA